MFEIFHFFKNEGWFVFGKGWKERWGDETLYPYKPRGWGGFGGGVECSGLSLNTENMRSVSGSFFNGNIFL